MSSPKAWLTAGSHTRPRVTALCFGSLAAVLGFTVFVPSLGLDELLTKKSHGVIRQWHLLVDSFFIELL